MSLLRIFGSLRAPVQHCEWAIVGNATAASGEGLLAQLPKHTRRVQLVLPATEVAITRARLPESARRRTGAVLAYAVEDEILGEPDANQVSWLGSVAGADVLAIADREGLRAWHEALDAVGIRGFEVHCTTLMLPLISGEWTLAWDGREGFVRTGALEGAATDCGDRSVPPLSLRLLLDEAKARGEAPAMIAVYPTVPGAAPETDAWQRVLGVAVRLAGTWDWRTAPADAGVSLAQERARWRFPAGSLARLKPAAWIAGAALILHAIALVADWTRLAQEQRSLRARMESTFRAAFPDAVAVADPPLQLRRKLTDARHTAGQPDSGDFLPMTLTVAAALKPFPPGKLRNVAYESGRMSLELADIDDAGIRSIIAQLTQAGLRVERGGAVASKGGPVSTTITVRSS